MAITGAFNMSLLELNKKIAQCNPYDDKDRRRKLVSQRHRIERQNDKAVKSGNLPASLVHQS